VCTPLASPGRSKTRTPSRTLVPCERTREAASTRARRRGSRRLCTHRRRCTLSHGRAPAAGGRYSAGSEAHILWGAGLRAPGQAAELRARLEAAGLPTLDVSAVEAAQVRGAQGPAPGGRGPPGVRCWSASAAGSAAYGSSIYEY